jgi:hypothetical protein
MVPTLTGPCAAAEGPAGTGKVLCPVFREELLAPPVVIGGAIGIGKLAEVDRAPLGEKLAPLELLSAPPEDPPAEPPGSEPLAE